MKKIVRMDWLESERGWGSKIDGTQAFLTMEEAKKVEADYLKEERERNPSGVAPDYYFQPQDPEWVEVDEETYNYVKENSGKWMVLSGSWNGKLSGVRK